MGFAVERYNMYSKQMECVILLFAPYAFMLQWCSIAVLWLICYQCYLWMAIQQHQQKPLPARPAKTVTDKAYGRTRHFRPLHTDLELRLLNPADRASAIEEDEKNKGPRMAVEVSFNNIVRKFTHSDYFATHRILQQGRSNWPYLRCLWDLQVLFYNLFSCAQGHGNPCNAILGVVPPTVSEYLYSANHNLLIPIPRVEEEDDNFGDEEEAQRMYYHIF